MTTEPKTKVIFRKFKKDGQIIAYFPELPGTNDVTTCLSYMHIGQHSPASVTVAPHTVPATEQEYKRLYKELEAIGYNLEVVSRFSSLHFDARVRAINKPKEDQNARFRSKLVSELNKIGIPIKA